MVTKVNPAAPVSSMATQARGTFGATAVKLKQMENPMTAASRYIRRGWGTSPTPRDPATEPMLSMVESSP